MTRYFTNGYAFWKFEEGERPKIMLVDQNPWKPSIFRSLDHFLSEKGAVEVGKDEAEPWEVGTSKIMDHALSRLSFKAPVAIWRGSDNHGEPLVILLELDMEGTTVGDEISRGRTLTEAVTNMK